MSILALDPETDMRARRRQGIGLRRLRERLGLGQKAMADRLHTSPENLRKYEAGRQVLDVTDLYAWAPAYEVGRDEFVRELGLLNEEPVGAWWARSILLYEGMSAEDVERHEASLIDLSLTHQRAVVDVLIRDLRTIRRRRERGGDGEDG